MQAVLDLSRLQNDGKNSPFREYSNYCHANM